jgi:3-deoxy-D-manno-octulosonic-acid transferase
MYFVYRLLLTLGFLVLIPRFLFDALRHGKYVAGFSERLGKLSPLKETGRAVVWLHCVSVGETQAARPLVEGIRTRFPEHTIVVSTTTLTGQKLARELFQSETAKVFYFPFDWTRTVRRALNPLPPGLVLIMETEIWPAFLRECEERKIPVAIVNGRLSPQSFRRYMWIKRFLKRVLKGVTLAVMQNEKDAERIRALGMNHDKIIVSGNMKFDAGSMAPSNSTPAEFLTRFNFGDAAPLIIAASTHAPVERVILEAFRQAREQYEPKPRLLLAPRHPERFAEVASLLDKSALSWTRRSAAPAETDRMCDVVLLDTIGELSNLYELARLVFVGGSIARAGGHNILEPAAVGSAIITGPHTHNFEAIVRAFVREGAIIQLSSSSDRDVVSELAKTFIRLLSDDQERVALEQKAKQIWEQNLGATERTLDYLQPILAASRSSN